MNVEMIDREPIHPSVPEPYKFNLLKHHGRAVVQLIHHAADNGKIGLDLLVQTLVRLGDATMDFYVGTLMPTEIFARLSDYLDSNGLIEAEPYRRWLQLNGEYRLVEFPVDRSIWTLRLADGDGRRFVHVHPGRKTAHVVRVRATQLRTAIMVHAYSLVYGGDIFDVGLINRVRWDYLNLPLIQSSDRSEGIGQAIQILADLRNRHLVTSSA